MSVINDLVSPIERENCARLVERGELKDIYRVVRESVQSNRVVFLAFSDSSALQESLIDEESDAIKVLRDGFHKVVVLDVSIGCDNKGDFDLAKFYEYAFRKFEYAFGFSRAAGFHEQDLMQLLMEEARSLVCLLNVHAAPSNARQRLRSLTQEHHHALVIYHARSDAASESIRDRFDITAEINESSSSPSTTASWGFGLHIVHSDDKNLVGSTLRIDRAKSIFGRGPFNSDETGIVVFDRALSKRHGAFFEIESELWYEDLMSRNGSFVEGRPRPPRTKVALKDGSMARLGSVVLVVRTNPPDDARQLLEIKELLPGNSSNAARTRHRILQAAKLKGPVLLLGETGTGKDYAARSLHAARREADRPFVVLNCGTLARGLAQMQLFGCKKGAFTDAIEREGLVAAAGNGTLFLDEIAELDLDAQAELLRFMEDGTYRPVGGVEMLCSAARVVAATNADLPRLIETGSFRRDLYARLTTGIEPIHLSPLRERREDLPMWFKIFVDKISNEMHLTANEEGQAIPRVWGAGVVEMLLLHSWPQNLRELRMVANETALAARGSETIDGTHIPQYLWKKRAEARDQAISVTLVEPSAANRTVDAETLIIALTKHEGITKHVANELGIDRREIYRLARRYGISPRDYRQKKADSDEEV